MARTSVGRWFVKQGLYHPTIAKPIWSLYMKYSKKVSK